MALKSRPQGPLVSLTIPHDTKDHQICGVHVAEGKSVEILLLGQV